MPKINTAIRRALNATGRDWTIREDARHMALLIDGEVVCRLHRGTMPSMKTLLVVEDIRKWTRRSKLISQPDT